MTYPISSTPRVFVDHAALAEMAGRLSRPGTKAVLLGFGEYAKHLINLHRENVIAIYDPDEWKHGITFRDIPVLSEQQKVEANLFIVCEYHLAYDYIGVVVSANKGIEYLIPSSISDKSTNEINVFEQEKFYRDLFEHAHEAPLSMMQPQKLRMLVEFLRLGLTFEGDVVEMGCWQGGSTWYLGKALTLLGQERRLFALDLFETHMMDPTATMCTEEITRKLRKVHAQTEVLVGLIDSDASLAQIPGKICFAHVDLGPIPKALEFVWERLSIGAPLILDNYGHIQAPTWEFDQFFASKNTRVTRLPWSEQGLAFKR